MTSVRLGAEVMGDPLEAFERFTSALREHWPELGLEPHAGGPVKLWRPGGRLEVAWSEPGWPEAAQTRLVASFDEGPSATQVTLEHTGFERLGEAGDETARRYELVWRELLDSLGPAAEG
jgi:hypothetical protein